MDETIETVKIKRPDAPGGYVEVNKVDVKPEDELYKEKRPKKKEA